MSIAINYKNSSLKNASSSIILFVNEKFNISNLSKFISSSEYSLISELLKSKDLKKEILFFEINSRKKIVLISLKNNV